MSQGDGPSEKQRKLGTPYESALNEELLTVNAATTYDLDMPQQSWM